MKKTIVPQTCGLLFIALSAISIASHAASYRDRLDIPAEMAPSAPKSELIGIRRIDEKHYIAVGERGHVLISADQGKTWVQSLPPLSSPLITACFPTPRSGWIVGHDGVVLHSSDGGKQWERQLDGRQVGDIMVAWYQKQGADHDPNLAKALEEARRFQDEGPSKPFLDTYFENDRSGWVIGSFNMILKTDDGGKTWEPWWHRVENPSGYSLHAMAMIDGELYIVGELGLLLRLDRKENRFVALKSPYAGTFFHVAGKPGVVLIYGLRGNLYRSRDKGTTWEKLNSGVEGGLVGGTFLDGGRLVLITAEGQLLFSDNDGDTFSRLSVTHHGSPTAVAGVDNNSVLITGTRGVYTQSLR